MVRYGGEEGVHIIEEKSAKELSDMPSEEGVQLEEQDAKRMSQIAIEMTQAHSQIHH